MITIKSLEKSHSSDVVKILIDSFSNNYDKEINESIFSSDEVDGIVALEEGNVLGYASIHYLKKITRKSGIIEDVVVKENQRGKGIGKLLVKNLIEKAKKNNCDKIILSSSEKNLKFYEKLGFQKNEFEMIMRT
tara:strand:+ start:134 stop:535 length:402 start_codon:yes stop_codon:yes gene_type:complete